MFHEVATRLSPGFDADEQHTSILRITEHIINLSDLVLVFFDALHPEPCAIQDTLEHLVARSINHADSNKFLYVLNQIDTTAREDNPEEVFGAWQRSLAQKGLTAGRFYTIYNPDAAVPIDNARLRQRYETKRDADLNDIFGCIQQVEVERAYRIVGEVEKTARTIEKRYVPLLTEAITRWRRRTLYLDAGVFGSAGLLALFLAFQVGIREGLLPDAPWFLDYTEHPIITLLSLTGFITATVYLHYQIRRFAGRRVAKWLGGQTKEAAERQGLRNAFARSTVFWRSLFLHEPAG